MSIMAKIIVCMSLLRQTLFRTVAMDLALNYFVFRIHLIYLLCVRRVRLPADLVPASIFFSLNAIWPFFLIGRLYFYFAVKIYF